MREKRQPDLHSLMHRYSDEAQYVLDRDTDRYLLVSRGFARLLGYSEEELLSGKAKAIVDEDYREKVRLLAQARKKAGCNRLEIKIIQKSGTRKDVELTLHNIRAGGRRLQIGSVRDIGTTKRLQKQLDQQVQLQNRKAIEVAKASVRIYQLTEKIKNAPELSSLLLEADSEETLLECATKFLTDPTGLDYRDVVFYIKEGESLIPRSWSSRETAPRRLSIYETSEITSVLRGEKNGISSPGEEILPLRGRGQTIGIAQINFVEDERVLFAKTKTVKSEQRNILKTIVDIIALTIVNLRLFQTVEEQSIVDQLTGAYNRRFFENKLQEEIDRASRYNRHLSLIYADLDKLKKINDSFGHEQGDLILKEIALLMKKSSRKIDFICRWGGDEFAVILPETGLPEAEAKAQKLRVLIQHYPFPRVDGRSDSLSVTVSFGVTHFTKKDTVVSDLFKRADSALYRAKQKGGNRVEITNPEL
jgi:diguanylate cyclase (GGDEF)-like protein/PAS domain S-box-containing protein